MESQDTGSENGRKEEFPYGRIYLVLEGSMLIKILFSDRVTHNFPERPSRGEGEGRGLGRLPQLRQGGKCYR